MKHRILFLCMIIVVLFGSILIYALERDYLYPRVHQHMSYPTEEEYSIGKGKFVTHLPLVNIDTGNKKVPGTPILGMQGTYELTPENEEYIQSDISLKDTSNVTPQSFSANISYRGNSSRHFDKKSYSIRIIDKDGEEKKESLLGMEAHDEWILNGPFLDRSLIRNYMAMNLAGTIMSYAPDVRFVELKVNGEYQGLYVLMETISKGEGRVEIKTPYKNNNLTSYIVELDRPLKMDAHLKLNDFLYYTLRTKSQAFELAYPGANQYTEERFTYVEQDFSQIMKSIYNRPINNSFDGINSLINVRAFQDYFIINELFRNTDAGYYSTFYYKDVRGLLTPVVWDFNNALDNYQEAALSPHGFTLTRAVLYESLLKDPEFVDGLIHRYYSLRNTVLNEERLIEYIDDTVNYLGSSIERNDQTWGYVYDLSNYNDLNYLQPLERNVSSQQEAVEQLSSYLIERGKWLDKYIHTLKQYSHPSRNAHEMVN